MGVNELGKVDVGKVDVGKGEVGEVDVGILIVLVPKGREDKETSLIGVKGS